MGPSLQPRAMSPQDQAALLRRRRGRNWAMLAVLVTLCALIYAIAMVKLSIHGAAAL